MAIHAARFKGGMPPKSQIALSCCGFLAIVLHAKEATIIEREESS